MTPEPIASTRPSSGWSPLISGAAWWVCGVLPPVAFRLAILVHTQATPYAMDGRGLLSDAASGLLIAAGFMTLSRWNRWLPRGLLALWILICMGDAEHVLANGAHLQAAYLKFLTDPTFLLGSALWSGFPLTTIVVALITGVCAWQGGRSDRRRILPIRSTIGAALLVFLISLGWRIDLARPEWRQAGLLESQIHARVEAPDLSDSATPSFPKRLGRREQPDLSGALLVEGPPSTPNILIILLEALSGAHIASLAENHSIEADPPLPALDRLARQNLAFSSFIGQQRQTNRGEYALLCGDWPKLKTALPRMSEYRTETGPRCLPQALDALGYTTVYLQAAPLGFMMKDQFMRRIGFGRVLGNAHFAHARSRTNWGVDDATLFEGARREIDALEKNPAPWMMTVLTVGTHHPFNVPDDASVEGFSGFERAARFVDQSLKTFIESLEDDGILENTLVLITSDESRGLPEQAEVDPLTLLLSRNWSFLIALTPEKSHELIDTPFLQSDLSLSILDYVAQAPGQSPPDLDAGGGRSLFRRYATPRPISFANTYQRRIFHLPPGGDLAVCREDLSACSRFETPSNQPFRTQSPSAAELTTTERTQLKNWLFDSGDQNAVETATNSLTLIGVEPIPVLHGPARYQIIFGGQGLEIPSGARVKVSLDVSLRGEGVSPDAVVKIRTNFVSAGESTPLFYDEAELKAGDRLLLDYNVDIATDLTEAEARFVIFDRSGQAAHLLFDRAEITIETGSEASKAEHQSKVVRREIIETRFEPRSEAG